MTLTVTARRSSSVAIVLLVVLLAAVGLLSRIAPLFDQGGRLLRQWPTEDGYLMLTIARNIAIGLGMSTAAGEIPTNGTQPLCTFLWSACFALTQGDKAAGVLWSLGVQCLLAVISAYILYRLARLILAPHPAGALFAILSAAFWFASPVCVPHTMNCLETGLYVALVLTSVWMFVAGSRDPSTPWSIARCVGLGGLLGLTFWARNDAVLLILAACLWHVGRAVFAARQLLPRRLLETTIFGATSVLVALPWMIFNKARFGYFMPISGVSESADASFGNNVISLPAVWCEYIFAVSTIPGSLETSPLLIPVWTLFLAGLVVLTVWMWKRATPIQQTVIGLVGGYAAGLSVFYGFYFGAQHFLNRYLFPVSAFLMILWVLIAWHLWQRAATNRFRPLAATAAVGLLVIALGMHVRLYRNGSEHMHFQVVEWVQKHVPETTWVAAVQTGTLGFFHDRTINLDGKVNPEALQARLRGQIAEYVVAKQIEGQQIEYLADWAGLAEWAQKLALKPHFRLITEVCSDGYGLAVLQRHMVGSTESARSAEHDQVVY